MEQEFKCRECGLKKNECSEVDVSVCEDCGFGMLDEHIFEILEDTKKFNCPKCNNAFIHENGEFREI